MAVAFLFRNVVFVLIRPLDEVGELTPTSMVKLSKRILPYFTSRGKVGIISSALWFFGELKGCSLTALVSMSAVNPDEYGEIIEENFPISYESGVHSTGEI